MSYCSETEEIMYAAFDLAFAISNLRPDLGAGIFGMQFRQLAQDLPGALVLYVGRLDSNLHNLVSALIRARVQHSLFPQPELLAVLRALRHFEQRPAVDGRHFDLRAQPRF